MCGQLTPLTRDFHRLLKNIHKLTNNQAQVLDYDDDVSEFTLEITPNDGYYKRGKFEFKVKQLHSYPEHVPSVTCLTNIYHPNIEYGGENNVCLSLFDEWTAKNDLEDMVGGLLFLLYNPNLDDPNNPYFDPVDLEQQDRFADDVQKSLEGGDVEGFAYARNIVDEERKLEENPEENTNSVDEEPGGKATTTTTQSDQNDPALKERNANEEQVTNCNDNNEANDKNGEKTLNNLKAGEVLKATQGTQPQDDSPVT